MSDSTETKQIAAQILAAMLSNPHIYSQVSDEGVDGQQEKLLVILAAEMAQDLIKTVDASQPE